MSPYVFTADINNFVVDASRYSGENASVLADCAKLSYQDEETIGDAVKTWNFNKFAFFDGKETGTQAYIAGHEQLIIVAFRGTEITQIKDLETDAELELIDGPVGRVHKGFYRGLKNVWGDGHDDGMLAFLNKHLDNNQSLWFCGHSLGAALATLAAAEYVFKNSGRINGLYTIGQPRTGNWSFARQFDKVLLNKSYRFINNNDVVTRVPLPGFILKYTHIGNALYIDSQGKLHDSISFWKKGLDMFRGALGDFGKLGLDNLKDHDSEDYVKLIEKNRNVKTKWS